MEKVFAMEGIAIIEEIRGVDSLKCICNENFDFGIFASSKNFIFSDHFDTK